jgi:hypothetical protein
MAMEEVVIRKTGYLLESIERNDLFVKLVPFRVTNPSVVWLSC